MQEEVRQEKVALNTKIESTNENLAKLQDEYTNTLDTKALIEQDKLALYEEKSILEKQAAAITAEQVLHVLTLQDSITELEKASREHKLQVAQQTAQVVPLK